MVERDLPTLPWKENPTEQSCKKRQRRTREEVKFALFSFLRLLAIVVLLQTL